MAEERVQRRLAAILAADVVGYSRMMEQDEAGTLAALKERIGPVFGRAEVRETAGAFLDGLLSVVGRKTGWLLAEQAGLERPYRMESMQSRGVLRGSGY